MQLSPRLKRFSEPETLKMAKLGRELRAKGLDVIDLAGRARFQYTRTYKAGGEKKRSMITGAIILQSQVTLTFAKPFVQN
jgi:hypothetical protein